ncbi:MAG: 50S ribosomal protein L24 [Thiotrichales bacterium 32-46-8]|jgi:large subunit ribosomal protein L24|nr:50S ribosomal protein L24 [Gammaproteobacteria bacterium]OYX05797.1 MAG: 50S ribosomal protein L24 [Thiotrichales bacterium 32-46-8]OYY24207.1 MAG: 50S ribosomal protein L24 [Thiotrichales bacterium 35-46-9]OYZ07606.1 MAG: 50S ribosomal protein L24 [Thiotrichales bacterium 16-46-22]OYZ42732.1 MAG: 50S ribosomal protein L24 [Thiotrichales bacterium 24-47-4]OZA20356.1 MAG: 50S ribosomal protein L24 [Thiotrichales bacterium 17-46-47]OZA97788.1 MAG: 50S ribosomal protein L24 [Thiotrichales bac
MNRIRKGDEVVVITGGDKGKRGVVATILKNDRIVVEGVNIRKKHVKANPAMGVEGGIIAKEATIHASNVALYNAETQKADRIGYKFVDGKKVRFFKSTGKVVD